jgi:transposase-like protein
MTLRSTFSTTCTFCLHGAAFRTNTDDMPGPTICPFCTSSKIRARLPVHGLYEYECQDCERTWLVARPKRQAKVFTFPDASSRTKRRASGEK